MLIGGAHFHSVSAVPAPANGNVRERFTLGFSAFVICVLAVWGWAFLWFAFAALADLGSAAMNFVSTNISASIS